MGKKMKIALIVGASIVGLAIIGSLIGGNESESGKTTEAPVTQAVEPQTVPTPQTTPIEAAPKPVDTGRMSDTEFQSVSREVDGVNSELSDYTGKVGSQCAAMLGVGQIAEAIECVNDAYDGVEGQLSYTWSVLDDMKDDTGRQCLRFVKLSANVLDNQLFPAAKATKIAFDAMDGDLLGVAATNLKAKYRTWENVSGRMLIACSPQS